MSNYKQFRDVHLWVGLILLAPVTVIAVTGLLWNHERTFGLKTGAFVKHQADDQAVAPAVVLRAAPGAWQAHAVSIDAALTAANQTWGPDLSLEKIELKAEPGYGLVVKIKAPEHAGAPEEIIWSVAEGKVLAVNGGPRQEADWAKVVHDLHTGKFFSARYGYLWSDSGAAALLALGLTGVVLYTIPMLKKRSKKQRAVPRPGRPQPQPELAASQPR